MADDDIQGGGAVAQLTRPPSPITSTQSLGDDLGSGLTTPRAGTPPAEADSEFTTVEVAGDPPPTEGPAETSQDGEVSSAGTATEFVEATAAELAAAEAGEESAVSDLRGIEGFEEFAGAEASATDTGLAEAGAAAAGESPEFLPILAALVPTLISTVGPMVAKGIAKKLSPRAKAAVTRLATPAAGAAKAAPGSMGALLAQLAQLLKTMQARPGGESSMESSDEVVVNEAVAVLEVILGKDDRIRINKTQDIPWRRLCALRITFPTGAVYRGTGFLIGPRAVATAGHCVYLHSQGGWARKVEVIPGSSGAAKPYGSVEATQFRSVGGWVTDKRAESDYGCILLPPSPFSGVNLGSFAVGALSSEALLAKPVVLAGYPGDKPFAELWGMARKISTVGPDTIMYQHDSMGGQSGAPVYIQRNGSRTVVGIHNYGSSSGNSATRVTKPVAERLIAWSKL